MKNLLNRIKLPAFLENTQLRYGAVIMVVLALAGVIASAFVRPWVALIMLVLLIGLVVASFNMLATITRNTNKYINDLSYRVKRGEQEALIRMPMGILMFDDDLNIEWLNPFLRQYFGEDHILGQNLKDVDENLAKIISNAGDDTKAQTVTWGDHRFSTVVQKSIGVIYLMDITNYAQIEERANDERLVIGQIFIDNYDEVTQGLEDSVVSGLRSYVTTTLSDWANQYGMFVKRIDSDHFMMIAYAKSLHEVITRDKFKVLDVIREETSKQNAPLTLSMGIAYGDSDITTLATTSQSNLDLALGRGGDQVVVKSHDGDAKFYGGKTNPMEKRTRVRARMISQALQELFKQADKVYVVGHSQPDMDSIGSSLGIRRIAQMNGKDCYVVLDPDHLHSDVERLMEKVTSDTELANWVITPEAALSGATDHSLLVMVDHSKPSITTAPELFERMSNRVVIIDHHRRGEEFPDNPMLVYIEPYASSTSELITEMFEYQPQSAAPLNKLEATAMLAGITVDTKNFSRSTGTRTFDAASYLRSIGADSTKVSLLLKENMHNYLQRNHLIESVDMIGEGLACCTGEENRTYDPVIAAQAADTLLSLSGITAGFVITKRPDGNVGISARSLGDFNVQVIMERLGGGGHLGNAATQLHDTTVAEAKQQLIDAIAANEAENDAEG